MPDGKRIGIGGWTAVPPQNLLESEGRSIRLEPRAMEVLVYLAAHAGRVVSNGELIDAVWHGASVSDASVYKQIQQLRAAFNDNARAPRYLVTVPKRGYRLIADVEWLPDPVAHSQRSSTLHSRITHGYAGLGLAAAALTVAALLIGLFFEPPGGRDAQPDPTIAVLPFIDASGTETDAALGEGIAEEIIHALANGSDLRVVSRTSSFAFAGTETGIRKIGDELGASLILEGSVRHENGQLRIKARLVESESSYYLWSEAFDRPVHELIGVAQDIAVGVAQAILGDRADTTEIATALEPVPTITAYDYYLLGRHHLRNPFGRIAAWSESEANQSIQHFRRAIEADPSFARAYAGLAEALLHRHFIGKSIRSWDVSSPRELAGEVSALIDQALTLDPQLAEAYVSRALALFRIARDMEGGRAALRQAIALNPNLAVAHYELGKYSLDEQERLAEFRAASQLDPMSAEVQVWLARTLKRLERYEEAASHYDRAVMLEPTLAEAIIEAALQKHSIGRPDGAVDILRSLVDNLSNRQTEASIREFARAEIARISLDLNDSEAADALLGSLEPSSRVINNRIQLAISADAFDDVTDLIHSWANAPLAIAQGPYNHVNDLTRVADGGPLPPLYEMMIGHDEHARDLFEDLASHSDLSSMTRDFCWGYYPAVNAAHLALKAGDTRMANLMLENARQALDLALEDQYSAGGARYLLASISAIEGDRDQALTSLREAIDHGWTRHWYAVRDPNLESLRGDARFESLIGNLKAEMDRLRLAM